VNAVVRSRSVVPLACVLVAACTSSGQVGSTSAPARTAVDPMDMTYTLSCDGIVPDGLRASVVDGAARIVADGTRPPYYDHYDIRVADTASGDVDGDGAADTVVLLQCSPQPSNGILQEVQVFSSAGSLLGTLPSPRTLEGEAPLPPEYQPRGLSVRDGEIVATMKAYGPEDFHASGPSLPLTVQWRFDGAVFERSSS
jgi:hypothetical protein